MEHIIGQMSFTYKQYHFDMFDLVVMTGQIKKILAGQVFKSK